MARATAGWLSTWEPFQKCTCRRTSQKQRNDDGAITIPEPNYTTETQQQTTADTQTKGIEPKTQKQALGAIPT